MEYFLNLHESPEITPFPPDSNVGMLVVDAIDLHKTEEFQSFLLASVSTLVEDASRVPASFQVFVTLLIGQARLV